jgi:hypothetical protein
VHARVVRFTDVDGERIEGLVKQIEESDGPPEGAPSTGIEMIVDEDQRTAVVIQYFDSEEDTAEGERVFGAMDPSDTPGTRAGVDRGAVRVQKQM